MLKTQLFSRMHFQATRMGRLALRATETAGHIGVLYGENHIVRYPLMALRTQGDLGPARHALSQIVISGEMVVFPPFGRLDESRQNSESV